MEYIKGLVAGWLSVAFVLMALALFTNLSCLTFLNRTVCTFILNK